MVDLICPNCGKVIGYASREDNYEQHFTKKCICGDNPNTKREVMWIIIGSVGFSILIFSLIQLINQCL